MSDRPIQLSVSRTDLAQALKTVCVGVRRIPSELRFDYAKGGLTISGPGADTTIDAAGHWPGTALVNGQVLKALAGRLPEGDPLQIKMKDGRLWIAGVSLDARWLDIAPPAIDVTVEASPLEILAAAAAAPKARIHASPWGAGYDKAKAQLEKTIDHAFTALSAFGVTREDLDEVAKKAIAGVARR